jgi:phenylalanyl-tRNA synthetase beta chain
MNPLSSDLNVMRQTLLFGGLETINYNTNRQRPDLRLFELGKVYNTAPGDPNHLSASHEEWRFAMFLTGKMHASGWFNDDDSTNYFLLKGYLENILTLLGFDTEEPVTEAMKGDELFTAGLRYIVKGLHIASLAIVSSSLLSNFDVRNSVFYAELIWKNIPALLKDKKITNKELPKYPEVRRDLALLLDRDLTYSRIREVAMKTESKYIKKVRLFDVYEGDKIEKGKKILCRNIIMQDTEKTLTDERKDGIMNRLIKAYSSELGATIR